eukprot:SAG31_NODE_234_length_19701_cov_16.835068_6_plen_600_part_00
MRRRAARNCAKEGWKLKYSHVLCDVPCSGDGTLRKNRGLWRKWRVHEGMTLHYLQLRILRRAVMLLGAGGHLVYSTCSMNPIEDEAVVAAALEVFGSDFLEVQVLPEWMLALRCGDGLTDWGVPAINDFDSDQGVGGSKRRLYHRFEEVPESEKRVDGSRGKKGRGMICRTMFPPHDKNITDQLKRCGRVLPSSAANSGGFFVCILKRLRGGNPLERQVVNIDAKPLAAKGFWASAFECCLAADDSASDSPVAPEPETPAAVRARAAASWEVEEIREGDWTCTQCGANVFMKKRSCFICKTPRPCDAVPLPRECDQSVDKKGTEGLYPLLVNFAPPVETPLRDYGLCADIAILTAFLDCYGLTSDSATAKAAGVERFPVENLRLLRRPQQRVLVLVSKELDGLAISEKWQPATDVGLFVAAMPTLAEEKQLIAEGQGHHLLDAATWTVYDEGVPVLARCATRRVLQLGAGQFLEALEAAVLEPPPATIDNERQRVVSILSALPSRDGGSVRMQQGHHAPWYSEGSAAKMLRQTATAPGSLLVSCHLKCTGVDKNDEAVGYFALGGELEKDGRVHFRTAARLVAAMVVAFEICSCTGALN